MTHSIPEKFRKTVEQLDSFIQESRDLAKKFYYMAEGPDHAFLADKIDHKVWLEARYREGRLLGILNMTFDEFADAVNLIPRWRRYQPKWRGSTWDRVGCPFRNGHSYRKNEDHEPKEGDDPKQIWREYKQMRRDKSKGRGWHCRPRDGIAYWKHQSAKDHRAWVKDRLHHEDWDAFSDQEYDQFCDPWDYD